MDILKSVFIVACLLGFLACFTIYLALHYDGDTERAHTWAHTAIWWALPALLITATRDKP